MAEENQPERDFFSELMFGRPRQLDKPTEPLETRSTEETHSTPNQTIPSSHTQPEQSEQPELAEQPMQSDQFEQLFALFLSLEPYIRKVAPLIDSVQSYFNSKKSNEDTDSK